MKRDFSLVRKILRDMESAEPLEASRNFQYEGHSEKQIAEHIELLIEANLLVGKVQRSHDGRASVVVSRLTWSGHDFLDAMSDETIWKKAQESVLKPAGGVAFDVLLEWLKWQAKKALGMPEGE